MGRLLASARSFNQGGRAMETGMGNALVIE